MTARKWRRAAIDLGLFALAMMLLPVLMQRWMIYPIQHVAKEPAIGATAGYRDVAFQTTTGLRLRALYHPASSGLPTLMFFHGNGDNLSGGVVAMEPLFEAGYGVLLPEYPGYGGELGHPSEQSFYAAGRGALGWLVAQGVGRDRIVIVGNSLGSGTAVQLASECGTCRALVVVSGFTSLPVEVAEFIGVAPARSFVFDDYDNIDKVRALSLPVLILHGEADHMIAVSHGVALAAAAGPHATLRLFPGVGHELAYLPEAGLAIRDWLRRLDTRARGAP